jgi:hypothetical protein
MLLLLLLAVGRSKVPQAVGVQVTLQVARAAGGVRGAWQDLVAPPAKTLGWMLTVLMWRGV